VVSVLHCQSRERTTKSARDENRRARLDWRDEQGVRKHRREMSLYGLGKFGERFQNLSKLLWEANVAHEGWGDMITGKQTFDELCSSMK